MLSNRDGPLNHLILIPYPETVNLALDPVNGSVPTYQISSALSSTTIYYVGLTGSNGNQILAARQSFVVNEILEEFLDIATEILDFTIRNERENRRTAVRAFVQLPTLASYSWGSDWCGFPIRSVCTYEQRRII